MASRFISGDELSDDEVTELVDCGTCQLADGHIYREWRRDHNGRTWLRRIDAIHGVSFDSDDVHAEGFIDVPNDDDDDDADDPVAMTWVYGDGDDE